MAKRNNYLDKIIGLGYVSWMNRAKWRSPQERRWLRLLSTLNEFQARLFAADKAWDQGRGGISRIDRMSRTTLTQAVAELASRRKWEPDAGGKIRAAGAGRKRAEEADQPLREELTR